MSALLLSWVAALRLVALSLILFVSGCSSSSSLPTYDMPFDSGPTGIQQGVLVEDRGCVYIREESIGHRWLVVWPQGYSREGETIRDKEGIAVAGIGQAVTLGGGEVPANRWDVLRSLLLTEVPAGCRDGDYWLMGGFIR